MNRDQTGAMYVFARVTSVNKMQDWNSYNKIGKEEFIWDVVERRERNYQQHAYETVDHHIFASIWNHHTWSGKQGNLQHFSKGLDSSPSTRVHNNIKKKNNFISKYTSINRVPQVGLESLEDRNMKRENIRETVEINTKIALYEHKLILQFRTKPIESTLQILLVMVHHIVDC